MQKALAAYLRDANRLSDFVTHQQNTVALRVPKDDETIAKLWKELRDANITLPSHRKSLQGIRRAFECMLSKCSCGCVKVKDGAIYSFKNEWLIVQ